MASPRARHLQRLRRARLPTIPTRRTGWRCLLPRLPRRRWTCSSSIRPAISIPARAPRWSVPSTIPRCSPAQKRRSRGRHCFRAACRYLRPLLPAGDHTSVGAVSDQQQSIVGGRPTSDAIAAFDYYIKHYNKGRRFILAGHSQGSNVMINLLAEYMKKNPKVYKRMIAAYRPRVFDNPAVPRTEPGAEVRGRRGRHRRDNLLQHRSPDDSRYPTPSYCPVPWSSTRSPGPGPRRRRRPHRTSGASRSIPRRLRRARRTRQPTESHELRRRARSTRPGRPDLQHVSTRARWTQGTTLSLRGSTTTSIIRSTTSTSGQTPRTGSTGTSPSEPL